MVSERVAFLKTGWALLMIVATMSSYFDLESQVFTERDSQPCHRAALFQIAWDEPQFQNRCIEDSKFLRQSWQKYPFGHPLRCRRSFHQSLFWKRSQVKIFS